MSTDNANTTQFIRQTSSRDIGKWLILSLYKFLHGLICAGIFYLFCITGLGLLRREASLLLLLFYLMLMPLTKVYAALNIGNERISELAVSQAVAVFLSYTGMFVVFSLIRYLDADFLLWLLSFVVTLCFTLVWTIYGNRIFFALHPALKTVIVHGSTRAIDVFDLIRLYPKRFKITKRFNLGDLEAGYDLLLAYDAVILNDVDASKRNKILKYCISNGIKAYIRPKLGDIIMNNATRTKMLSLPMITIRQNDLQIGYQIFKRAWDTVLALLGLIVFSPLMLIIALFVKLGDGGPVFYRQTRLTKGANKFSIVKFRTMRVDAEKDGVARLACRQDNRITPVGRFLRASRLDELPQLFNILQGDMSFVGPRPERPEIARQYAENLQEFNLRLLAKAGLTGYAQVYGKYNAAPYDKLQMDLIYLVNRSIFTDLKLMFATLKVLLTKESTDGVQEGQVTAVKDSNAETSSSR